MALALPGCQRGKGGSEEASNIVVHNRPPGKWENARKWHLVEEVRIGSADAEGPFAFAQVVGVALDPLGRVWVADGMQHQIRVFDHRGSHVRSIGRKGHGPREFDGIAGIDWGPDGNLWVLDAGNARYAVYDTAGALVETRPRTATMTVAPWPGGFDAQGRLYDLGTHRQQGLSSTTSLLRMDLAGGAVDTFRLPPIEERDFGQITRSEGRNTHIRRAPVPFTGTQVWTVDPRGYVWVASTDRYRIERLSPGGTADRIVELENTPPRVTRAEKDRILENYAWFEAQGGKLDRSRIPDTYPHLLGFFFDDAENLWVVPTYPAGQQTPLDVFDTAGAYQGRLRGPPRLFAKPAPAVRGDRMVAVIGNADGVHTVALFRIEKPAR